MRTRVTAIVVVLVLTGAGLCAWLALRPSQADPARRQWKDQAIADIARDWHDAARCEHLIAAIRAAARPGSRESAFHGQWFTTDLLLAADGQWIAARCYCRKQAKRGGPRFEDIFIGRASDGKWYYSTYHFCFEFTSLHMDAQPATLAELVTTYHLKEFDGRSDEALKKTWPQ